MLNFLKKEAANTTTLNGGMTHSTSNSHCLDLFFRAGAMRNASPEDIANTVRRAFAEDPVRTMKIVFYARDVRGGLGERRFFRIAMQTLAVDKNKDIGIAQTVHLNLTAHVALVEGKRRGEGT